MKPKIAFVASSPTSVVSFLLPHVRALNRFYSVEVLVNSDDPTLIHELGVDIVLSKVSILRFISIKDDVKAVFCLYNRFKQSEISAVHSITPKAGLLSMLAAWIARVPIRVHTFTGQVWVTHRGPMRWLLKTADKCIATLATHILVDSQSQRTFLIKNGIVSVARSKVLADGSISGVDIYRFRPDSNSRRIVRRDLDTAEDAIVCLYLGRLNRDKGVLDLASAFSMVAVKHPKAELWIVGPDEANFFEQMQSRLGYVRNRVKRVGFTSTPELFMQAADIFCLPSYREGFGSSVIEAGACGLPALASRIYGLTDAIVEGKTGWMHEAGNLDDLANKLSLILSHPSEIINKGQAAKQYAETVFNQEKVTMAMIEYYQHILNYNEASS